MASLRHRGFGAICIWTRPIEGTEPEKNPLSHQKMYSDHDPGLAELREICLGLPDATEVESHGRPTFRTRKIFAVYGATTKGGGSEGLRYPYSVLFLPDPAEAELLLRDERFFVPAYYGPYGWLGFDLAGGPTDWLEVRELVETSYRNTAPARSVRRLDQP